MTNERRQDVLLVALLISVAAHVGLMFYARSQVMTTIARGGNRPDRPVAMQVVQAPEAADAAKIEELMDLDALKEAPVAELAQSLAEVPDAAAPEVQRVAPIMLPETVAEPLVKPAAFDVAVADGKDAAEDGQAALSVMTIDTALAMMTADAVMPVSDRVQIRALPTPALSAVPSGPVESEAAVTRIGAAVKRKTERFQPASTVYEKVDEQVVAEEKAAVKLLVDQAEAEELAKFVNVGLVREQVGEWMYFKVMIMPRTSLRPVPKDVVLIIDASGSIGSDRMSSIRGAAKRILRSATNSDDRFNLVAFRDRFSYAFQSWQACTRESFDRSDGWLNNLVAHGRTDVFGTIASVLTLPRDPQRPLIALVITDGDANAGVRDNAGILSQFTALNGGLVSVYMYGVKSSANRELIDVLTHGNRGESFIFDGWRWNAGEGIENLSDRFRDPVLSDLSLMFVADCPAEAYPRYLRNLYRGDTLELCGRVHKSVEAVAFSLRGLNGVTAYDGFFRLPLSKAPVRGGIAAEWERERDIDLKLK